jgi:ribosomal protein L2
VAVFRHVANLQCAKTVVDRIGHDPLRAEVIALIAQRNPVAAG